MTHTTLTGAEWRDRVMQQRTQKILKIEELRNMIVGMEMALEIVGEAADGEEPNHD